MTAPQSDRAAVRNRGARWVSSSITAIAIVFVPALAIFWLASLFSGTFLGRLFVLPVWGALGGLAVGILLLGRAAPKLTALVPQVQALVTQDPITKEDVAYGPGLHLRHWWERVTRRSHLPLDVITFVFGDKNAKTKTYPTIWDGSFLFQPNLANIHNFFGLDESTIREGFVNVITGYVNELMTRVPGEIATSAHTFFRRAVSRRFGVQVPGADMPKDEIVSAFGFNPDDESGRDVETRTNYEDRWGITTVGVHLQNIDPPQGVTDAMGAIGETAALKKATATRLGLTVEQLDEAMATLVKKEGLSRQDLNRGWDFAAAQQGDAKRKILTLEGTEGIASALVGLLMKKGG